MAGRRIGGRASPLQIADRMALVGWALLLASPDIDTLVATDHWGPQVLREFKAFLITQNAFALAIAVVLGAAVGKVVQAIVDDFIMPIVGAVTPAGEWQKATWDVGAVKFGIGDFASALLNFLIIGFVVWRISKIFLKPAPTSGAPVAKQCSYCRMSVDTAATRCPHCTSQL